VPRIGRKNTVAQALCHAYVLFVDFLTDLGLENLRNNFTGSAVFDTIQQTADNHETFRNNSARLSGMHADIQGPNFYRAPEHTSER